MSIAETVSSLAPLTYARVLSAVGGEIWVANNTSSTLSVIDVATNAVTATVDLGLSDEPTTIAFA